MNPSLSILCIPDRRYPTNQAFLTGVFAKLLPERGHRVTWIIQSQEPLKKVQYVRWYNSDVVLLPAWRRDLFFKKIPDKGRKIVGTCKWLTRLVLKEQPDIIQIRNDWIAALWAIRERRKHGIPVVFQFSRPGPSFHLRNAQEASFVSRLGLLARGSLEKRLIPLVLKYTDHILPISEWMKESLVAQGIPEKQMTSFPLGFDTTILPERISGQRVRSMFGLGDAPVVIYFGEMGRPRQLDFLLRAHKLVVQRVPNAKLLMLGGEEKDGDTAFLQQTAYSLGVSKHIVFIKRVPLEEVPEYIAASDVGVSPIPPIPIYWNSSPAKLIETLGMARPIVTNDIPEQRKVIHESNGGLCVLYEENAFADAIVALLSNPERAKSMGLAGRNYVEQERSFQQMAVKLESLYFSLLEKHKQLSGYS